MLHERASLTGSLKKSADPLKTHLALVDLEYSPLPTGSYNGDACPGTNGATRAQLATVRAVGFLLDVVLQSVVGVLGAVGNLLAIAVLGGGRRLRSFFNRLLTCLLVVHTVYIANSLVLEVYKKNPGYLAFDLLFSNFFYPCKPMLLYTTTFLTVLMARER